MNKLMLLLTLVIGQAVFSQKQQIDYLFTNVNIVTMNNETILKNKDVAVKDGKITGIVNTKKGSYEPLKTIDCKGKYLTPTLADAHVHLPDDEKELEKVLTLDLINGVTKIRSMRGDIKHLEWKKKYNAPNSIYPKMYLSGIPVHRSQDFTNEQLEQYVKSSKSAGFDFIKILSIKNKDIFTQLDKLAKENNIKMAGHFPSDPKGVVISDEIIFNSNLNSMEHLGGLIGEPASFESRIKSMKEKNVFSCPTLRWYEIAYGEFDLNLVQKQRGIEYIDPKIVASWVDKTTKYREKMGEKALEEELDLYAKEIDERLKVIKRLNSEGIKLLLSPDSSSKFIVPGFGMMQEMQLYKKAGLSNFDVLKSATVNYANYTNDSSFGTIETGKNADFLILSKNPLENIQALESIEGIFFNNNYLNKTKLEELANSVLPSKN
ncbi:MAG: amidohydrolase family protein [Flavobacterium sp. JAD_PAG50586_2]|nr:MAG: amidohydrolase family protein [Flavobacterium sp. JAD_PAG50586_2]